MYLATREETTTSTDSAGMFTLIDTHPQKVPGIALAAVGGAALVGGVVMIVLDARRQKKRNASKASAMLSPTLRVPGLVLTGRF